MSKLYKDMLNIGYTPCKHCNGTGKIFTYAFTVVFPNNLHIDQYPICEECDGRGFIKDKQLNYSGFPNS